MNCTAMNNAETFSHIIYLGTDLKLWLHLRTTTHFQHRIQASNVDITDDIY